MASAMKKAWYGRNCELILGWFVWEGIWTRLCVCSRKEKDPVGWAEGRRILGRKHRPCECRGRGELVLFEEQMEGQSVLLDHSKQQRVAKILILLAPCICLLCKDLFQISYMEGVSFVLRALFKGAKTSSGSATAWETQSTLDLSMWLVFNLSVGSTCHCNWAE